MKIAVQLSLFMLPVLPAWAQGAPDPFAPPPPDAIGWTVTNGAVADFHGPFGIPGNPNPNGYPVLNIPNPELGASWAGPDLCLDFHLHGVFQGHADPAPGPPATPNACGHGVLGYIYGGAPMMIPGLNEFINNGLPNDPFFSSSEPPIGLIDNPSRLLGVLNPPNTAFQQFWVFSAATTNPNFTLTINNADGNDRITINPAPGLFNGGQIIFNGQDGNDTFDIRAPGAGNVPIFVDGFESGDTAAWSGGDTFGVFDQRGRQIQVFQNNVYQGTTRINEGLLSPFNSISVNGQSGDDVLNINPLAPRVTLFQGLNGDSPVRNDNGILQDSSGGTTTEAGGLPPNRSDPQAVQDQELYSMSKVLQRVLEGLEELSGLEGIADLRRFVEQVKTGVDAGRSIDEAVDQAVRDNPDLVEKVKRDPLGRTAFDEAKRQAQEDERRASTPRNQAKARQRIRALNALGRALGWQ
jgi:hypothetical protein